MVDLLVHEILLGAGWDRQRKLRPEATGRKRRRLRGAGGALDQLRAHPVRGSDFELLAAGAMTTC